MEKEWTGARLHRRSEKYFDAISKKEPLLLEVPVCIENEDGECFPRLDDFGHPKKKYVKAIAADGKEVKKTVWFSPPGISELCLALGVSRERFLGWCALDEKGEELSKEDAALCYAAKSAKARIEAYFVEKSLEKGSARGAIANLEANFGWKHRKEIGLDEQTRKSVCAPALTTEEKLAQLREMGLRLPGEGEE